MRKLMLPEIISSSAFFLGCVITLLYFLSFEIINYIMDFDLKSIIKIIISHSWLNYAEFVICVCLCIVMIMCKRKLLFIPFFLMSVLDIYILAIDFDIIVFIRLSINVLMSFLVLRELKTKRLFLLPGFLSLCCLIINFTGFIKTSDCQSACIWLIVDLLRVTAYVSYSYYLVNYQTESVNITEKVYGYFDLTRHALLLFFTFGIWNFMWIYRTTKFLNNVSDEPKQIPILQFFLCMIPFYPIYWGNIASRKIDKLCLSKNINIEISWVCTALMTVIIFLPPLIMQSTLNKIVTTE